MQKTNVNLTEKNPVSKEKKTKKRKRKENPL
jgi:hypothetical protein